MPGHGGGGGGGGGSVARPPADQSEELFPDDIPSPSAVSFPMVHFCIYFGFNLYNFSSVSRGTSQRACLAPGKFVIILKPFVYVQVIYSSPKLMAAQEDLLLLRTDEASEEQTGTEDSPSWSYLPAEDADPTM